MQMYNEVKLLVCATVVSALPTYPITFLKSGQVLSTVSLFIQGIISYQAQKVYLKYMRNKNESMDIVISRYIGRKWGQCYLIVSLIYLLQLTLLYSFYTLSMLSQVVFYFVNLAFKNSIQQKKKKQICNIKSKVFLFSTLSILGYIIYIGVNFVIYKQIENTDSQLQYSSILQIPYLLSKNNLENVYTVITGSLAGFFILYLIPYKIQFAKFKQAQKILYKNLNIQDSSPFTSIQEAQEEDSKLMESQTKLLPYQIQIKKLKKDLLKSSLKKANFSDKAILLFGFFISMYGILYFIYSRVIFEINVLVCTTIVSALPIYPLSFKKNGRFLSALILLIQGVISYQVEKVYLKNMKTQNERMDMVVSRQIGRKWGQCYLIMSIIYLLQLTLLYSFYALGMFSQIIFYFTNQKLPYHMAISTLIISPLLFFIILKRRKCQIFNIKSIAFFFSSLCILIYIAYIFQLFSSQLKTGSFDLQLEQISILQIANLLSSNNLAYENQLYLHQMLTFKNKKVSKESKLSVKASTVIVFLIYSIVGIVGSYTISELQPLNKDQDNFIFDYFNDNTFTIIVKIFMVYHFLQNLSYRYILLRNSLLNLILVPKQTQNVVLLNKRAKMILNIVFSSFFVFINLAESNLQYKFTIMTGSLAGFFIIYLVPYKLQFGKLKQAQKCLVKSQRIQDFHLFSSLQEAQEEDSKLMQSQINLSPQQLVQKIKEYNKIKIKKANFFDKTILLIGFFISMYGIFYFIYFIIN
ncbi:hypothetical protein ABPG74_012737 [Tetrahymena malaccensis]